MVLLAHVLTENQRMSSSEGMHETEEGGSFETLAATAAMLILVRRWGPWTLHIMFWKSIGLQYTGQGVLISLLYLYWYVLVYLLVAYFIKSVT